jgi:hypothetical protein
MAVNSIALAKVGTGDVIQLDNTRVALLNRAIGLGIAENARIASANIGGLIVNNLMYKFKTSGSSPKLEKTGGIYVYLYYDDTTPNGLTEDGNFPSFVNKDWTIDESKLIGYFDGSTSYSTTDLRKGIMIDREGDMLNVVDNLDYFVQGMSFYAAPGYCSGTYNCIAITSVDLLNLPTILNGSNKLLYGKALASAENEYMYGYIRNGVTGLTGDDEIIIKGSSGWYKKNLVSGKQEPISKPAGWDTGIGYIGSAQFIIDNNLYYIDRSGRGGSSYYPYICRYNFADKTQTAQLITGEYTGYDLIKINGELYQHRKGTSILNKVDLATLGLGETITLSKSVYSITNIGDHFGCTLGSNGPTIEFTDLLDIDGTIIGTKFINGFVELIDTNSKPHYIGFWGSSATNGNSFGGSVTSSIMEADPNIGVVLGYHKHTESKEKKANDEIYVHIYDIVENITM